MHLLPKASYSKGLTCLITTLLIFLFAQSATFAQTPGLIYKPATNGGNKVLDPNGDGYVSTSTAGFTTTTDEGSTSEIPYRPIPALVNEPLGDLTTGSTGGHTDLAPPQYAGSNGSPVAAYFDGKNLLFRVRLGGQSTASKGYSIMIDTDNNFGNLVAGGNPTTTPNPGFEFEVVLASNFDVSVYNHTGLASGSSVKHWSGSVNQYSQKSVAASTGGGNPDYFYDFYVPLSALPGVTAETKLRMSGLTITRAQSSISGTVSDLGGVNFAAYGYSKQLAWADLFKAAQPTSLTDIQTTGFTQKTTAPVVFDAIRANSTTIAGSSVEAAGTVINVYQGSTIIATGTVQANGTWSASLNAGVTLAQNDVITARATATGKTISDASAPVTVKETDAPFCTSVAPTIEVENKNRKGLLVTSPSGGNLVVTHINSAGASINYTFAVPANSVSYEIQICGQGNCLEAGKYYATIQPTGGCVSTRSNELCYSGGSGNSVTSSTVATPTLTSSSFTSTSYNLSGSSISNATITLLRNGVAIATTATGTGTTWSFSSSNATVKNGDVFQVRATINNTVTYCGTNLTSAPLRIDITGISLAVSAAPSITGTYCGTITTLTGTSTEQAGTTIRLYAGTSTTALAQTGTVTAYGTWSITGLSIAPGTSITAKATAIGKSESAASNAVSSSPQTSNAGLAITGPIAEYATVISGTTAAPAGSTVKLYIAGSHIGNSVVTSGSSWSISGISYFETFAGASVYVTVTSATGCESAPSAALTIQCKPTDVSFVPSTSATPICYGSTATVNMSSSEAGTVYNLYINGTQTGTSVLGTGGAIKLFTSPMFQTTSQLQVTAIRVGADCPANIGSPLTVTVYEEVPNNFDLTATTTTSACPNVSTNITLTNAVTGYTYQLIKVIDANTKQLIGTPIAPVSAGNITFTGIVVPATSTYSVLIKRTSTECAAENVNTKYVTVSITGGADVTRNVTISSNKVCVGESSDISVATQTGFTYKVLLKGTATQIGALLTGDGTTKSVNTQALNTAGTYTYTVEVTSLTGTCPTTNMATEVSVEVANGSTLTVSAGPNQSICGATSATMAASDPAPGVGTWSIVSQPINAAAPTFSNINNRFAVVSGLVTGTYTFRWTVISCGATKTSEVTITINCPAVFSVTSSKYFSEYANGEIIAAASDVDDGIVSARLISGTLPQGTTLDSGTGNIIVTDRTALQGGNYYFTVRTTDAFGISTDSPLAIQIYDPNIAPTGLSTLPVELVYFTALVDKTNVTLQWLTASEKDNDKFLVERSSNGKDYVTLGTVKGAGNSSTATKYNFSDNAPLSGTAYYRLKQVDFDGKHTYSKVLPVTTNGIATSLQVQTYPNPFTKALTIAVTAPQSATAQLQLYDLQGRVVLTKTVDLEKGMNELAIGTEHLTQGLYILAITGNGIDQKVKVLKAL